MFITLKKKTLSFLMAGIFFVGISWEGFQMAAHPMLKEWQKENLVISQVKTDEKLVAFTFDDGPHPHNTVTVLDMLEKYNFHATFFVTGRNAQLYPELLQRMAQKNHEIGNHSYSHVDYSQLNTEEQMDDFHKTNQIIHNLSGQTPVFFRPPGGYLSIPMVEHCKEEGIKIASWSYKQDSKDWRDGVRADYIANFILGRLEPGQIIILHDGCSNGAESAKALETILPELINRGYKAVTMSEIVNSNSK